MQELREMRILSDEIHDCINCNMYPCTLRDDISGGEFCKNCRTICCRNALIALFPCEIGKLKEGIQGFLKSNNDKWCYYFDNNGRNCSIYDKRPIICRIFFCNFMRKKLTVNNYGI